MQHRQHHDGYLQLLLGLQVVQHVFIVVAVALAMVLAKQLSTSIVENMPQQIHEEAVGALDYFHHIHQKLQGCRFEQWHVPLPAAILSHANK